MRFHRAVASNDPGVVHKTRLLMLGKIIDLIALIRRGFPGSGRFCLARRPLCWLGRY